MTKVLVTGGSGKLGRAVLKDLVTNGYEVINLDQTLPAEKICPTVRIDLSNFGEVATAILGGVDEKSGPFDAVVHLAAIPAPGLFANARTFANNVPSSYNVFEACKLAGITNVVFASSETVLGLPFDTPPPYVPVDEEYFPRPESAYSLGKLLDETMAAQYCRWNPELKMVGLRFSNVMYVEDYAAFPGFNSDAHARKWNLWGYIDARDGAQAVRRGLEADFKGFEPFIIANADTVMSRSNDSLMAEVFPGVEHKTALSENGTLLSINKARRMLDYNPQHSWRNHV
ncbi:NAD-dependent epimerase/dehydratase family protein [Devosia sp.]|uniref:NAD-dependent epimerase/dehydratase family protein n=1 Tax=Devosia sp. TaxID=1871048 RepID=UPI003A905394